MGASSVGYVPKSVGNPLPLTLMSETTAALTEELGMLGLAGYVASHAAFVCC